MGQLIGHSEQRIGDRHRVDRVVSFFSSRRNWDSPNPSPAGECAPPPPPPGSGGRSWESPNSDEGTYTLWYSLYIRTLWRQGTDHVRGYRGWKTRNRDVRQGTEDGRQGTET